MGLRLDQHIEQGWKNVILEARDGGNMSYPKVQHLEAVNLIKRDPNPLGIISCLSSREMDHVGMMAVLTYEHPDFMMRV